MSIELSVMDLFCGCGGLSAGLSQANLNVRWANEHIADTAKSYKTIHPYTDLYLEGAETFRGRLLDRDRNLPTRGEVDVVVGGPPCQGFAGWNRHRNPADARNSLVDVFLDVVDLLLPRFVIMENVTGILTMSDGRVISGVLGALEGLGYKATLSVVQAGNYGVPQNRWRVIVLAGRSEFVQSPKPLHSFHRTNAPNCKEFRSRIIKPDVGGLFDCLLPELTVRDAIGDLPPILNGERQEQCALAEVRSSYQERLRSSEFVENHETINLEALSMERVRVLKEGQGWLDLPDSLRPKNLNKSDGMYDNRYGRLRWDGSFNCIVQKPEPYWGRFLHPEQDRVISVRECARAQGLPDSVKFYGPLRARYAQVGNAVPPPLARALGWELRRALSDRTVEEEVDHYRTSMLAR